MEKGKEFELYVADLLYRAGCEVFWTGNGMDYGVDLIAVYEGERIAVQCKYYTTQNVGNRAVQAVVGGKRLYDCKYGCVVTNAKFTPQAKIQAQYNNVLLIDGTRLGDFVPDWDGNVSPFDELLGLVWRLPQENI